MRQYRDRVDTDAQADAEAVANIAILLSAIIDQVEAWDADWPSRGDAFAHGLLDLLASAHIRRASPKLFLVMQAISSAVELTETHGPGERGHARFLERVPHHLEVRVEPGPDVGRSRRQRARCERQHPEHAIATSRSSPSTV